MTEREKQLALVRLIERLHQEGSWCGETHIQKGTYLLQELAGVPLGFKFVLYKYGPYSFELNAELHEMLVDEFLKLNPRPGYGPSFEEGETSWFLKLDQLEDKVERAVNFVATRLGDMNVKQLEPLATALMVTISAPEESKPVRLKALVEKKPHLSENLQMAEWAIDQVDQLRYEASTVLASA